MQNSSQYYKQFRNKKGIFISSIFIYFYRNSANSRAGEGLLFAGELQTLDRGLAFHWEMPLLTQTGPKTNSTEIREHILTSNYTNYTYKIHLCYARQRRFQREMTTAADAADISSLCCVA